MSLLKKLFGRRSGAERLSLGERLLTEGTAGDARLELEAALAANDLPEAERPRAEALLGQARDALAQERLRVAEALVEAGDLHDAQQALELAAELATNPAVAADVDRRLSDLRAELRRPYESPVPASGCQQGACATEVDVDPEESAAVVETLETALLSYPEAEAHELETLAANEPHVEKALVALIEGHARDALEHWSALGDTVARGSLVRRERARAALVAGETEQAAADLEEVLPQRAEDPDTLELLMEARFALGDAKGAAALARRALEHDLVRNLPLVVSVLAQGGEAEQALAVLDHALEADGKRSASLWELRGFLCSLLDRPEEVVRSDKRALERFSAECSSCGSGSPQFPLASARRLAEHYAATPEATSRARYVDLLRLLSSQDPERGEHWGALLRTLGG